MAQIKWKRRVEEKTRPLRASRWLFLFFFPPIFFLSAFDFAGLNWIWMEEEEAGASKTFCYWAAELWRYYKWLTVKLREWITSKGQSQNQYLKRVTIHSGMFVSLHSFKVRIVWCINNFTKTTQHINRFKNNDDSLVIYQLETWNLMGSIAIWIASSSAILDIWKILLEFFNWHSIKNRLFTQLCFFYIWMEFKREKSSNW